MKKLRYILFVVSVLISMAVSAGTYTVDRIPNVHVADSSRYVSDPDHILDAASLQQADEILRGIRREQTVEAVAVIVEDIEGGDIDGFATELFTAWGLGKSDLDNGLLVLIAKDLRRAAIRTGYGLEGVLPDITCGRILRNDMFPHFKRGRYGEGLVAALTHIDEILSDPEAANEIRSSEADADFAARKDDADIGRFFAAYFLIAGIGALVMLLVLFGVMKSVKGRSLHDKYQALNKLKPLYLALTFVGLGVPAVASIPLVFKLRKWRDTPRKCPHCGTLMNKVDEVHDNDYLQPTQDTEERIGSVDYDVWLCPRCGETDIEAYEIIASGYRHCEKCGGRTSRYYRNRVLRNATTMSNGHGIREYQCAHCGHITAVSYIIPKLVVVSGVSGGSGRGGGFGGGFGGGMTGGGGASGGW